ncbi:MAG: SDR family NAD(P)-dependent oxidoreductase [Verrucomicrobiota bacterium]
MRLLRKSVFFGVHQFCGLGMHILQKLQFHGLENLPERGPFIIASNHCSHMDTAIHFQALGDRKGDLRVLAAEDYFFKNRLSRTLVEWMFNGLPMGRRRIQPKLLNQCSEETNAGKIILIFPEGTRQMYPEIASLRGAVAMLAAQCGVPVVPARIFGSHRAMPKGQFRIHRFPVEAHFGKPIIPTPLPESEGSERKAYYAELNARIGSAIKALKRPSKGRALITGASSGIGAAMAEEFAGAGYDLILTGRNSMRLDRVKTQCEMRYGIVAITECIDFSDSNQIDTWLKRLEAESTTIDILVNNAGLGNAGGLDRADPAELDTMIQVNIRALTLLTRAVLPKMKQQGTGKILNIGSVYGVAPVPRQAVYGASKAFVHSLSVALCEELKGTGISVTSALPGSTDTDFHNRLNVDMKRATSSISARTVARELFRATLAGKATHTVGAHNVLFVRLAKILPSSWVSAFLSQYNSHRGL